MVLKDRAGAPSAGVSPLGICSSPSNSPVPSSVLGHDPLRCRDAALLPKSVAMRRVNPEPARLSSGLSGSLEPRWPNSARVPPGSGVLAGRGVPGPVRPFASAELPAVTSARLTADPPRPSGSAPARGRALRRGQTSGAGGPRSGRSCLTAGVQRSFHTMSSVDYIHLMTSYPFAMRSHGGRFRLTKNVGRVSGSPAGSRSRDEEALTDGRPRS